MTTLAALLTVMEQHPLACLALVFTAWITIYEGAHGLAAVIAAARGAKR